MGGGGENDIGVEIFVRGGGSQVLGSERDGSNAKKAKFLHHVQPYRYLIRIVRTGSTSINKHPPTIARAC